MRLSLLLPLLACSASALAQAPPPAGFPGTPPPSPPAAIREFAADPASTEAPGSDTTLRWEAMNAYSLTIEPDVGVVATRGARSVAPRVTTTYTLTALGPGGATTRSVTVTVPGTRAAATPQAAARQPTAIPRLAGGKPDLSGVYSADRNVRLVEQPKLGNGAESFRVAEADERDSGTGNDCLPPGVPAATMLPFPLQLVHTPNVLAIMYEAYHQFRIAPISHDTPPGAKHAEYLAPAWMGHSAAYWDGDTLVVDVRGFNDRTVIAGYRHTEDLRVVERYTRTSYDTIAYDASSPIRRLRRTRALLRNADTAPGVGDRRVRLRRKQSGLRSPHGPAPALSLRARRVHSASRHQTGGGMKSTARRFAPASPDGFSVGGPRGSTGTRCARRWSRACARVAAASSRRTNRGRRR